jgi:hypothetical protein
VIRVVRTTVTAVLLLGLLGCSSATSEPDDDPSPSEGSATTSASGEEKFQPTEDDRAAIRDLLDARAQALEDGDRKAFMATVDKADQKLVHQQQLVFDNLQQLPVVQVAYDVDDAAGWVPAKVKGDDPVFRPRVLEQVRLDIDDLPVTNVLEDTFVRRESGWLLGAESIPGKYRDDDASSRPWGGGVPITSARSGRLIVVVDQDRGELAQEQAENLAGEMSGYIAFAADALGIEPAFDVLVDATTVGAATSMSTLEGEQAAAISRTVVNFGVKRGSRIAGARIKVNPKNVDRVVSDEEIMRHELAHYLTRGRLAAAPSWVREGIAEWVSTAPASLDNLVFDPDALQHVLDARHELPTTGRWGIDPTVDYLVARAAVTRIVVSYGVAKVFELGAAYGRVEGDDPDVKTGRVLRRVLGISEGELVRMAYADLESSPRR